MSFELPFFPLQFLSHRLLPALTEPAKSILPSAKKAIPFPVGKGSSLESRVSVRALSGEQSGKKILKLQKELRSPFTSRERKKEICKIICDEFKKFVGNYPEMLHLRTTIDHMKGVGVSPLFQLVYEDVDESSSRSILNSINDCFQQEWKKEGHGEIKRYNQIYTDLDDTIKPSINDRAVDIQDPFYPGTLELYQKLGGQERLKVTVLSARPKAAAALWSIRLQKEFPKGTQCSCLFGSAAASGKAIQHYAGAKGILTALANRLPDSSLKTWLSNLISSSASETYIAFAADKRRNIDRDLLLRPEARGMMVGDTGEGDLLFLFEKNSAKETLSDPRIPDEYRAKLKDPLALSFAHAISSRPVSEYGKMPSPQFSSSFANRGIHIIDNFVDAALICYKRKELSKADADKVVETAKKWLYDQRSAMRRALQDDLGKFSCLVMDDKQFSREVEKFSPYLQYRLKLMRSIEKYKNLSE